MESFGEYGSKIQTLIQHLLWVQRNDIGAKSIIFSAWADSIQIIAHALSANGIPFLQIASTARKVNPAQEFARNSMYQVLLLHG